MARSSTKKVAQYLRKQLPLADEPALTDGQLLECYINCRDEVAFAALVRRHGRMVWGVCRRVIGNAHDAEDAFQATFLVLVRKAPSIAPRAMVADWLYGVAYRTALNAGAAATKRRRRERPMVEMDEPEVVDPDRGNDWQPLLDQELRGLPDKYRAAIVLCDLDGKTRQEAARQLGWPEGTVAGRLARARQMLTRRGLALSGGSLAAVLAQQAALAGASPSLAAATIETAMLFAAGQTVVRGVISAKVAALTDGVLKAMLIAKLKVGLALLLVMVALGVGIELATHSVQAQRPAEVTPGLVSNDNQPRADEKGPRLPTKEPERSAIFQGHEGHVYATAFSPDGKTLASASEDKTVKLWDVATGKERATLQGHTDVVFCVAFSPDGKTVASGGWNKTVKLWDAASGKARATLQGNNHVIVAVAFSPDGKTIVSSNENKTVKFWDAATGKERATFGPLRQDTLTGIGVWPVAFSSDSRTAAVGWGDPSREREKAILLDLASHKQGISFKGTSPLAFSPDGKTLASGSFRSDRGFSSPVTLWEVAGGTERAIFRERNDQRTVTSVRSLAFSPDGKTLAAARDDEKVRLWDVAEAKEPFILGGHTGLYAVAFSPDGKVLATQQAQPQTVKLWDVATGKELASFKGRTNMVMSPAFSPDGKTLALASEKTIRLWEVPASTQPGQPPAPAQEKSFSAKELDGLWTALADQKGMVAYDAIVNLVKTPQQALFLLQERLQPARPATAKEASIINQYISDLDDDEFAVRQQAREELEKIGERAVTALQQKLSEKPALEVTKNIEQILTKIDQFSPRSMRTWRALEVLERIGSPEAEKLLERIAAGAKDARLTKEAQAALRRLNNRLTAGK